MKSKDLKLSKSSNSDGEEKLDGLQKLMLRTGIPMTREEYINLKYFGDPPAQLSPEEEEDLPKMFRK